MFSDYDAPLSEAGEYTQKYHLLKDLFSRFKSKLSTEFHKGKCCHKDQTGLCKLCAVTISTQGEDNPPDMPTLHYREAYEPTIMYQHLSLWDALSFTEGVRLCKIICCL